MIILVLCPKANSKLKKVLLNIIVGPSKVTPGRPFSIHISSPAILQQFPIGLFFFPLQKLSLTHKTLQLSKEKL